MAFLSKVRGTIFTLFRIGNSGPQVKNNSGVIEMRDSADAAFAITRGLDPVGVNDYVTKNYHDTNNDAAQGLTYVKLPLALATKVSTSALPDNAIVRDVVVDVTAVYDASATFDAKRTGDATKELFATSDVDLATVGQYHVPHILDWEATGAGTVTATLTNSPTVGAADVYIGYVTPTDIT